MGELDALLELIAGIFSATFFGITAWHAVGGSLVLILFVVLRSLFAKTAIAYLTKMTQKTETDLDDKVLDALKEPLKLIPIILGIFFLTQWFGLPPNIITLLENLTQSLFVFAMAWALYKILNPFSVVLEGWLEKLTRESETLYAEEFTGLIIRGFKVAIMCVGTIIVLSQWGVNVVPLLGGLGIIGMAVGLASQDTIKNWFAGVKILLDGQFKRGDWIKTPDIEGVVMEIGIATTRVREFDKAVTSIPNSDLTGSMIKNYSKMFARRVKMTIGLEYSTTANQLENVVDRIREHLKANPEIAQPEDVSVVQMVHLVGFGGSSIDISLYYFTVTTGWADWRRIVHENMLTFKHIVENEGAAFAFPSQSIYLESTPSEAKQVNEVARLEAKDDDVTTYVGSDEDSESGDG